MDKLIWALLAYIGILGFYKFDEWRSFKESPYKLKMYKALPIYYKLLCPLVVLPLFLYSAFNLNSLLVVFSFIMFVLVDFAIIDWYKRNDLY